MGNTIKIGKRLFLKSSHLAAIINKSRIFNTYEAIIEVVSVVFFNIIPSRTNQTLIVGLYTSQAFLCILGDLYIHVSPKRIHFRSSIVLNVGAQVFMIANTYLAYTPFRAVLADCQLIWAYYDIIGQESISHSLCKQTLIYYGLWLLVVVIMEVLRNYSLVYMIKSFRYLSKREAEKKRKKERRALKQKRIKKERRKELQQLVQDKKDAAFQVKEELILREIEEKIHKHD